MKYILLMIITILGLMLVIQTRGHREEVAYLENQVKGLQGAVEEFRDMTEKAQAQTRKCQEQTRDCQTLMVSCVQALQTLHPEIR